MEPKPIFLNAPEEIAPSEGIDAAKLGAMRLPDNPFVGLRPFNSSESMLFFGRRRQIEELLKILNSHRFVAVVGSSGCGKSSLIQAGLIPDLKAGFLLQHVDRWAVASMRPGDAPQHRLATALFSAFGEEPKEAKVNGFVEEMRARGAGAVLDLLRDRMLERGAREPAVNLLLLVDQFEEIFRFGSFGDEEEDDDADAEVREQRRGEAADFVSIMLELSDQSALPVYVVTTMRSDFLSDCDAFYGLPEAMNRSQYLVPRLTRAQRQEAIENPVRHYGEEMAARLTDRVLNDMGDDPDQLPVMQHALMRTWEKWAERREGPVDLEHYEHPEVGTIKNALSLDAERAIKGTLTVPEMDTKQKIITKRMFQALTQTDAKGRRLRRPARVGDIAEITESSTDEVIWVVNRFIDDSRSFLFLHEAPTDAERLLDISHESLIRKWEKLRKWVDAEARSRNHYLRISGEAESHAAGDANLLTGTTLQVALRWWGERQPTEPWARRYHKRIADDKKFLEKSKEDFARTEKYLRESERVRTDEVAAKDAARQLELKQAKQLARQRMTIMIIFIIATVLFALLYAEARAAQGRAAASAKEALDAQEALRVRRDELETLTGELERKRIELEGTNKKLDGKRIELEGKQIELEGKNEELKGEKIKQQEANDALAKTVKDLKDEQERGKKLKLRGEGYTAYAGGVDADQLADHSETDEEKLSNLRRAHASYGDAIDKFKGLKDTDDQLAGARIEGKLGKVMRKDEFALANAGDEPEPDQTPEPGPAFFSTAVPSIVKVVLASAAPRPEDFRPLGMGREKREALKHYGTAIASYRRLSAASPSARENSAALLDELGEFFNPSGENIYGLKGFSPEPTEDVPQLVRKQVAIELFCAARDDLKTPANGGPASAANIEKQIALLLKVGYRLLPPWPEDEATQPGDTGLELSGCQDINSSDPVEYFGAALNLYKELINKDGATKSPMMRRAEAAGTAVRLGKLYLSREDGLGGLSFFVSATEFYDDSPEHAVPLARLYARIINVCLNKEGDEEEDFEESFTYEPDAAWAALYMDQAISHLKNMSPEARDSVADDISNAALNLGDVLLTLDEASNAEDYLKLAADLYPAEDVSKRDKRSAFLIKVADAYFTHRLPNVGTAYLEQAVNLYGEPATPEERKNISDAFLNAAYVAHQHRQMGLALKYFNRPLTVFEQAGELAMVGSVYDRMGDIISVREESGVKYYVQAAEAYGRAEAKETDASNKAAMRDKQVASLLRGARRLRMFARRSELNPELKILLLKSYADVRTLYPGMTGTQKKSRALQEAAAGYVEQKMYDEAVKTYRDALAALGTEEPRSKADYYARAEIFLGIGGAEKARGESGIAGAVTAYLEAEVLFEKAGVRNLAKQAADEVKNLRDRGATPTPTPTPTPSPAPSPSPSPTPSSVVGVTLKARLTGADENDDGPKGRAKLDVDDKDATDSEFEVRVEQVNLPADTPLDVWVDGLKVGSIALRGGGKRSSLILKSKEGGTVPSVNPYSRVVVKDPAGSTVVSGSFGEPCAPASQP